MDVHPLSAGEAGVEPGAAAGRLHGLVLCSSVTVTPIKLVFIILTLIQDFYVSGN